MKRFKKILIGFLLILVVLVTSLITWVDRTPYRESSFHQKMQQRLDSLERTVMPLSPFDSVQVGWSKVSITPDTILPLAGYGARDPKEFTGIHDSVFVRTYVLQSGSQKKALMTAEMLVVHPEVHKAFKLEIDKSGWDPNDVYLMATHTHSSLGSWAPGFVGNLFAGEFNPKVVKWLAKRMVASLKEAESNLDSGSFGFAALSVPDYVKNRLVNERGTVDPWIKLMYFSSDSLAAIHAIYSAHATCLNQKFTELSGDFPTAFIRAMEADSTLHFASFSAGAVASMGPANTSSRQWEKAEEIGAGLAEEIAFLSLLGIPKYREASVRSFRLPVELREPNFKVSGDLRVRPWVFRRLFGDYQSEISFLQVNDVVLIGLPCDFSGELAVPLYEYAEQKGINLVLTSFNGGYIGYVPHDKWYDLPKYETRTMAWYGFDNGAYFTEIIKRLIDLSLQ